MSVPVLYYHSIGNHKKPVPWSFLSYPYYLFELQMKYLVKKGYRAINLMELYKYMDSGKNIPEKPIVLTFDDGFLDNWVFAFPILKKYGLKATIYINPDFVDNRNIIRFTLEDVWSGKLTIDKLDWWGYLSWDEMKLMENSGLINIESHSLTHTWYFSNEKIIDFHHPGDKYYWIFWNEYPEEKPQWLQNYDENKIEFGRPVYKNGKALVVKKYFEDIELKDDLINYVKNNGGKQFFSNGNWKQKLYKEVEQIKNKRKINERFESQLEYEERITQELSLSKKLIEKSLKKTVNFLCWPGGGQNEFTFNKAYELGYLSTTKGPELNKYGNNPKKISRLSGVPPFVQILPQKLRGISDIIFLYLQLKRGEGKFLGNLFGNFMRFLYFLVKSPK